MDKSDVITQLFQIACDVGGEEDGMLFIPGVFPENIEDLVPSDGIQSAGGLIQDEQLCLVGQRHSNGQFHLHAAGEFPKGFVLRQGKAADVREVRLFVPAAIGITHDGIAPAPRGIPQIEVTFDIDANGIVNVSAKDMATGKEQKITISSSTNMSKEEVEKAVQDAEKYAAEDKKKREEVDAKNEAENLCFSAEKVIKDAGDKIDEADKNDINQKIATLRETISGGNVDAIKLGTEDLQKAVYAVSEKLYKNQAGQANPADNTTPPAGDANGADGQVYDADFKDVDSDKKDGENK